MTWRDCTLGDVITLKRGHDLPERRRVAGPVPVVSSAGITGRHNEAKACPPGVVTGRYGTIGEVYFIEEPYWPLNTALYVTDFKGNAPRFVAYLLRNTLRNYKTEKAAVPGVDRNVLHTLKVQVPNSEKQAVIVSILSAYDDLIENNRQRIALLEAAARLLYREWFVHFRFPGHEHVKITDGLTVGWERRALSDVVEVVKNTVKPSDFTDDDIHIGLGHIPRRSFTLADWESAEDLASGKTRFDEGDILFCKIRPYFHKVGFTLRAGLASSDALVWRVKDTEDWPLVVCATSSDHFVAVASKTVREGSKMPRADWKVLEKYSIPEASRGATRDLQRYGLSDHRPMQDSCPPEPGTRPGLRSPPPAPDGRGDRGLMGGLGTITSGRARWR